jgi:hypothetical protein
VEEHPI